MKNYSDFSKRMTLSSFSGMIKKEYITLTRYPVSFIMSFFNVILQMSIFVFAALLFTSDGVNTGSSETKSFGTLVSFGMILYILLTDIVFNVGNSLMREQQQGTLESLFLTPASQFLNVISRGTQILLMTVPLSIFMLIVTTILFNGITITNSIPALLFGLIILILSLSAFFGFGFILVGMGIKYKENMNNFSQFMNIIFLLFLAPFYPFSALPEIVRTICYFIPFSYNIDLFRTTMIGTSPELFPNSILLEFGIVCFTAIMLPLIGYIIFKKAVISGRERGSISSF